MIPNIRLIPVKPDGEDWVQMSDPGNMKGHIAYNFVQEQSGEIVIFFNSEFYAFVEGVNNLTRKKATQPLVDSFRIDYELALKMLVLSEIETRDMNAQSADEVSRQLHSSRADAARAAAALSLWNIERYGEAVGSKIALDEAA